MYNYIIVKWAELDKKTNGGFQLDFVSISRVINHITCCKFECSLWWKIYSSKKSYTRFALQSECYNITQWKHWNCNRSCDYNLLSLYLQIPTENHPFGLTLFEPDTVNYPDYSNLEFWTWKFCKIIKSWLFGIFKIILDQSTYFISYIYLSHNSIWFWIHSS